MPSYDAESGRHYILEGEVVNNGSGAVSLKNGKFPISEEGCYLRALHESKEYEIFYAWDLQEGHPNRGKPYFLVDDRFRVPRPWKGRIT